MSYTLIREYLVNNNLVDPSEIFDIQTDDLHHLFEQLSDFCEVNLNDPKSNQGIGESALFFYPDYRVNGRAFVKNGVKLIRINMGAVVTLHNFFMSKHDILITGQLGKFKQLNSSLDVEISFLLYQITTLFIFYHEKAHLIQFIPNDQEFTEGYENNAHVVPFSLLHHVHEYDADCEAAFYSTIHLIDYWKRLPNEMKTPDVLEDLLSLGMAGIVSYWIFLSQNRPEIYYRQSTHPHPLVRLVYATDIMSDTAVKNAPDGMKIDAHKVMREAIFISDTLFQSIGDDRLSQFGASFELESDNIENYVNDLIRQCAAYPNLVRNRR